MRKFLVFVFLMSFASLAFAGIQDKVTIDFRDTDLREICKILAKQADMGIAIEKSVRGNISITVKNAPVREALDLVAEASGFAWVQKGNNILISEARRLSGRTVKIISLKHINVNEAAKILASSIVGDLKIATCQHTNGLVLNGSNAALEDSMQIIGHIDRPAPLVKGSLKLMSGAQLLEKFDFQAGSEESVKISQKCKEKAAVEGKKAKAQVEAINCEIVFSGISSAGLDATVHLGVSQNDKVNGKEAARKFSGRFQAEKGKSVTVFATSDKEPLKVIFTWEN